MFKTDFELQHLINTFEISYVFWRRPFNLLHPNFVPEIIMYMYICNKVKSFTLKDYCYVIVQNDVAKLSTIKMCKSPLTLQLFLYMQRLGGNLLRSVPFLMAGHFSINIFQTLGAPFFNTNPDNGCPKMICQYSGRAPRHFTCCFHHMSCSTDVRPWDSKRKFVFLLQIVPITKTLVPNASK